MIQKFAQKIKRSSKHSDDETRTLKKSDKILNMLKGFSKRLLDDAKYSDLIKNPLKNIIGNEDLVEVSNKIGQERLIGILQAYDLVKRSFINQISKKNQSTNTNSIIDGIYQKIHRIEDILEKKKEKTSNK